MSNKTKYLKLEQSSVLRRDNNFIVPTLGGSGPFKPKSEITFEFNRLGFIDLGSLVCEFSITSPALSIAGTTNPVEYYTNKFKTDSGSIFSRVQVMFGSQAIIDYQDYSIMNSFLANATSSYQNLMSQGSILEGYVDPEADLMETQVPHSLRFVSSSSNSINTPFSTLQAGILNPDFPGPNGKTNFGAAAQTHMHRFKIGFFSILQYFPAHLFQNFRLKLTLEDSGNAIVGYDNRNIARASKSYVNCLGYEVTDLRLYYDVVEMDPVFQDATRKLAQEDSLYIPFIQLNRHLYSIPEDTNSGARVTLDMTEKVGSLKALFLLPVPQEYYRQNNYQSAIEVFTFQTPVQSTSQVLDDNISNFQLRLAGTYYPLYPATTFSEIKYLLLQSLSLINDNTGSGVFPPYSSGRTTPGYWNPSNSQAFQQDSRNALLGPTAWKPVRTFNVYGFDFDREECADLLCGTNTIAPQSNINISFTNNTTTRTAPTALIILTLFNSTLRLLSSGNIDILR
jgi:hypothetical protein